MKIEISKTSNSPRISIIVPVYNTDKYLSKCILSILNQTYSNIELIIIVDGATDYSSFICDCFSLEDDRIIVVEKKNSGVSESRNVALDILCGDYIGFVDSDDYIDNEMYDYLLNQLLSFDADLSIVNFTLDEHERSVADYPLSQSKIFNHIDAINNFANDKYIQTITCSKLFKKEVLCGVKFNSDISIGEDMIFVFDALLNTKKVCVSEYPAYHYIQRVDSAVHIKKMGYWSVIEANKVFYERCLKNAIYDEALTLIAYRIITYLFLFSFYIYNNGLLRMYYHSIKANVIKYLNIKVWKKMTLKQQIGYTLMMLGLIPYKMLLFFRNLISK